MLELIEHSLSDSQLINIYTYTSTNSSTLESHAKKLITSLNSRSKVTNIIDDEIVSKIVKLNSFSIIKNDYSDRLELLVSISGSSPSLIGVVKSTGKIYSNSSELAPFLRSNKLVGSMYSLLTSDIHNNLYDIIRQYNSICGRLITRENHHYFKSYVDKKYKYLSREVKKLIGLNISKYYNPDILFIMRSTLNYNPKMYDSLLQADSNTLEFLKKYRILLSRSFLRIHSKSGYNELIQFIMNSVGAGHKESKIINSVILRYSKHSYSYGSGRVELQITSEKILSKRFIKYLSNNSGRIGLTLDKFLQLVSRNATNEQLPKTKRELLIITYILDSSNYDLNFRVQSLPSNIKRVVGRMVRSYGKDKVDGISNCNDYIRFMTHLYSINLHKGSFNTTIEQLLKHSINYHERVVDINNILNDSRSKRMNIIDGRWEVVHDGITETNDYSITPIRTSDELRKEGEQLNHCVGSYERYCITGTSFIFSIKNSSGNNSSTVEFRRDYSNPNKFYIAQHRAKENREPNINDKKLVDKLLKELNTKEVIERFNSNNYLSSCQYDSVHGRSFTKEDYLMVLEKYPFL